MKTVFAVVDGPATPRVTELIEGFFPDAAKRRVFILSCAGKRPVFDRLERKAVPAALGLDPELAAASHVPLRAATAEGQPVLLVDSASMFEAMQGDVPAGVRLIQEPDLPDVLDPAPFPAGEWEPLNGPVHWNTWGALCGEVENEVEGAMALGDEVSTSNAGARTSLVTRNDDTVRLDDLALDALAVSRRPFPVIPRLPPLRSMDQPLPPSPATPPDWGWDDLDRECRKAVVLSRRAARRGMRKVKRAAERIGLRLTVVGLKLTLWRLRIGRGIRTGWRWARDEFDWVPKLPREMAALLLTTGRLFARDWGETRDEAAVKAGRLRRVIGGFGGAWGVPAAVFGVVSVSAYLATGPLLWAPGTADTQAVSESDASTAGRRNVAAAGAPEPARLASAEPRESESARATEERPLEVRPRDPVVAPDNDQLFRETSAILLEAQIDESEGRIEEAAQHYRKALDGFRTLAARPGSYFPDLVGFRIRHCDVRLKRLAEPRGLEHSAAVERIAVDAAGVSESGASGELPAAAALILETAPVEKQPGSLAQRADTTPLVPRVPGTENGLNLCRLGDYAGAARHFERLLEREPADLFSLVAGAACHYQANDYDAAEARLLAALDQAPARPELHRMLAQTFLRMDRMQEAMLEVDQALALRPDDPLTVNLKEVLVIRADGGSIPLEKLSAALQIDLPTGPSTAPHVAEARLRSAPRASEVEGGTVQAP